MYCFDEDGNKLGVISCFPEIGEEHGWYDAEGNPVFSGRCKRYESKKGYCLKVAIFERV